jgi:hypothetical protein
VVDKEEHPMPDDPETILQRLIKGHEEKDLEAVMSCWHPDIEAVHPMRPDRSWKGAETFRRFQKQIWDTDPDQHYRIVSCGVIGNVLYVESLTGHKDGTLVPCVSIQEVENGKVRRMRVYTDSPRHDGISMNAWVDEMDG